jgi:hypothetical protein
MNCDANQVDDAIRHDFETMPSHLFQDKYRDVLTKYVAHLADRKANTAAALISGVRSFFTNEAVSIKLQNGKIPRSEIAMNEHRFTHEELRRMWHIADLEGKARLSTAISLGWSVGEFLSLDLKFIKRVLDTVHEGFATFDYRREKTKARIRGILNPNAVNDLTIYLKRVQDHQERLWTTRTVTGLNYWLKTLYREAGIREEGRVRFHLLRKYVFDKVSATCGIYEAKLLVGKKIPLADATYLHGLEERLLERYKRFAYHELQLDGRIEEDRQDLEALQQTILTQQAEIQDLQIRLDVVMANVQDEIKKSVQDESFKREIAEELWKRTEAFFQDKERRGEGVIYDSRDVEGVDVGRVFVYHPKPNDDLNL